MSTINSAIYVLFSAFVEVYSRDFKLSTPFKDEILPKISNLNLLLVILLYLPNIYEIKPEKCHFYT